MTPKQIKLVRGLLSSLGLSDVKADLARQYSNERTESLSELSYPESHQLITFLMKEAGQNKTPKEKMKGKIMSMCHEMRWELPSGKVNVERLNAWCIKYGHQHKEFDKYTVAELPALVTQIEKVYNDFLNGF